MDGYIPGSADGFQAMQVEEERSPELRHDEGDEVVAGAAAVAVAGAVNTAIFKTDRQADAGAMNLEDIGADLQYESDGEESIFKLTGPKGGGPPLVVT